MVVHGDDFIVAGCGDNLDWLSQKLNEKLECVQRGNCVEALCEGDPRHAELAVAELGLQAARQGGAKPSGPLDHEELEPAGQKAYTSMSARLAYLALDRPNIAFAGKECSRAVGKATTADLSHV